MAEYPGIRDGATIEDTIASIKKTLSWIMNNLDSMNVTGLNTNVTKIQSENGETYINGPVLEQGDKNGTLRLRQGLDLATLLFVFQMFNTSGQLTVDIDSDGNLVVKNGTFTGTISASTINGSNINGGTINVQTDVTVGNNLYVGDPESGEAKAIYLFNSGLIQTMIMTDIIGNLLVKSGKDLGLSANRNVNIDTTNSSFSINIGNSGAPVYINGVRAATQSDISDLWTAIGNLSTPPQP